MNNGVRLAVLASQIPFLLKFGSYGGWWSLASLLLGSVMAALAVAIVANKA